MEFVATAIAGAFLVRQQRNVDERGHFARTFCEREFAEQGLINRFVQSSISFNERRGTLRGMHWSDRETKLVGCSAGTIFDVIVDIRAGSTTRGRWAAVELSPDVGDLIYIPNGVAHGFLTLTNHAIVSYSISDFYDPAASRGFRYDDEQFGIVWPFAPTVLGDRDRSLPLFTQ